MSAGFFFLILLVVFVFVVCLLGAAFSFYMAERTRRQSRILPGLTRQQLRRLADLEKLVYELRETAFAFRETDTSLSYEITERIAKFQAEGLKELED